MMFEEVPSVRYDRSSNSLESSSYRFRIGVGLMRAATSLTAPFGYAGISRLHGAIGKMFPQKSITEIGLAGGGVFCFPSGDYYYNRLLSRGWDYEEDIQAILKTLKNTKYSFVDIGANFGFFSVLASSEAFGSQSVVAVEPSLLVSNILERNLAPHAALSKRYRLAIDSSSGNEVKLYGTRHAGFSLSDEWYGAGKLAVDVVKTVSIDDLMVIAGLQSEKYPLLIKLEVEGIEMRALQGAVETLQGDVAIILEEADRTGISEATKYVFLNLGFQMFYADGTTWREIKNLQSFADYRKKQQGVQARGTSVLAFKNEQWRERFKALL